MDGTRRRYFAYGSNMSTAQMTDRCPGACRPVTAVLADHAWICNDRGVATIVPVAGRTVHGVIWEVTDGHLASLDRFEGVADGRYRQDTVRVMAGGEMIDAIVYVDGRTEPGPPRDGYMDRVLGGAAEHGLPETWIDELRRWDRAAPRSIAVDPDTGPQTLAELLATPGVAETVEVRSRFGFMAVHGGELEEMTDVIASAAADAADASLYTVRHPADLDHHLPSIRFLTEGSDRLERFLDHVDVVISIHGYGRPGRWTDVMVGGASRSLAAEIGDRFAQDLDGYRWITDLDDIPRPLRGMHPDNPVNRPTHAGVQLELPPRLRGLSPLSPPPGPDGLSPPTRALIDALADVARRWNPPR